MACSPACDQIDPTSFTFVLSVYVLIVIVLGGTGSLPGVLLGALIVIGLPEVLRTFQEQRLLIFGIGLLIIILRLALGIWPRRPRAPRRLSPPSWNARRGAPRHAEA